MNNKKNLLALVIMAQCCMPLFSCGDPPASQYPSINEPQKRTTLSVGDKIRVRIEYGTTKEDLILRNYVIDESGEIALPYIDTVVALDKTASALRLEIKEKLADGYLRNPIVWIDIEESFSIQFSVLGEVKNPNRYSFRNGMSILDAISQAGGFTGMARKNAVTVLRRTDQEQSKQFTVPVGKIQDYKANDFKIMPGDVITVPPRLL